MIGEFSITAIIPAYNEEKSIGKIVELTKKYTDEVIVIDDGSQDNTAQIAKEMGADVIKLPKNIGIINKVLKQGINKASGEIIVKLDADGEHNPEEIPRLVEPIIKGEADLVLGKREKIPRVSERFINWITNFKVKVADSGTGFKAGKKELLQSMKLIGRCPCGTFVLEAYQKGAKIKEVPVSINKIEKKRKIAWGHFWQFFYVLKLLFSR